ncbi:GNAT family N-acetyltransferase [Xenorhabdus anantnagensis]|uniref:GNAT family N-acetyltransferase n=1 Tax=Xenorhabdus anantnagensis TaxID=3025875 RepID=A0ABT5LQJ5_9GAMM|nr:GNAT family N-acetyltransferase [Xenorhabdus anantnagensis]MDC9596679.1 GNAT family N-acetyltransferase [Xenorhabdus anantnagensis]
MPKREELEATARARADYHSAMIMEEKLYLEYQAKIKEVSQHGMLSALNELQRNESSWYYEPIIGTMSISNRHATFIKTCDSIKKIFNDISVTGGLQNYRHFICSCSVTAKAVGIIILSPAKSNLSDNDVDQISFIVTYPNGYGYGGLLIQHVINISLTLGHQGILEVKAERDAEIFYQKLGFVVINDDFFDLKPMKLTPADSNKWHQINGEYQLKRIPRPHNSSWRCHLL